MTSTSYISDLLISGLGTTLLHSIWQGLAVGALLSLVLYLVPRTNVQLKYWLSVTALTGLLFWTGYTFNQSIITSNHTAVPSTGEIVAISSPAAKMMVNKSFSLAAVKPFFSRQLELAMPYMDTMVMLWSLGVLFFLLRLQGSILYLRRLKTAGTHPVSQTWQRKTAQISRKLGLQTSVQLLESKLAEVPMVIGHLKPIILIPVGMLSGLAPSEVEAILAHELAHVKRYDYLINIFQTVIESLLFFNPAVWWISQTIRKHREHCCDDIAVRCCGNQLIYASALSNLGAWSLRSPALGMGLFKTKNELLMRIKRLVYPQVGNQTIKDKLVPGIILTLMVVCLSWYSHRVQAQLMPADTPKNTKIVLSMVQPDPVKEQKDTIPDIEVEENVEVLPPMEPVPVEEEWEIDEDIELDIDVEVDLETMIPDFEAIEEFGHFVVPPNFDAFAYVPDVFVDIAPMIEAVPDVFVNPDIDINIEEFIDIEQFEDVMSDFQLQLDDTTRERIQQALEEQRQALEQAMMEQEEALEKARQQLRESLQSEKPEELTEEEWEMAKEKIEHAERSLERAMERSSRELERALEGREYEVHKQLERVRKDMDRNRIVLRHVQRDRDFHRDIARAHRHANRFHYRWDSGNEADLRQSLLKDGLIDEYDSDISLSFSKSQIKINDVKLEGTIKNKYRKMLDDMYGEASSGSLTFSK